MCQVMFAWSKFHFTSHARRVQFFQTWTTSLRSICLALVFKKKSEGARSPDFTKRSVMSHHRQPRNTLWGAGLFADWKLKRTQDKSWSIFFTEVVHYKWREGWFGDCPMTATTSTVSVWTPLIVFFGNLDRWWSFNRLNAAQRNNYCPPVNFSRANTPKLDYLVHWTGWFFLFWLKSTKIPAAFNW